MPPGLMPGCTHIHAQWAVCACAAAPPTMEPRVCAPERIVCVQKLLTRTEWPVGLPMLGQTYIPKSAGMLAAKTRALARRLALAAAPALRSRWTHTAAAAAAGTAAPVPPKPTTNILHLPGQSRRPTAPATVCQHLRAPSCTLLVQLRAECCCSLHVMFRGTGVECPAAVGPRTGRLGGGACVRVCRCVWHRLKHCAVRAPRGE